MYVRRLKLTNWRNFREVDIPLQEVTYLVGANAAGKSNLLDVFRFLRDVCKPDGGGLQAAIKDRQGFQKLRCLHARKVSHVGIEVELAESSADGEPDWRYLLAFAAEGKGAQRTVVKEEKVWRKGELLLDRPGDDDRQDNDRLLQTHLQQVQANQPFRDIAGFFAETVYLHVVPQLLKFGDQIGGQRLENDPFGQGLLETIARVPERVRKARLDRINKAFQKAIPSVRDLRFVRDIISGRPHLEARYEHYRPNAGWQREEQFSDGTLRLIGLLWSLSETGSILLLEEPELSLNEKIVEQIPRMIASIRRDSRRRRQILLSTHSAALLNNKAFEPKDILILTAGKEGSTIRSPNEDETEEMEAGLSAADAVLRKIRMEVGGLEAA